VMNTREVLRSWDVIPDSVSLVIGRSNDARSNAHWRIHSGAQVFVLRGYRAGMTSRSIDYEIAVLRHLRDRCWPVAVPVTAPVWRENRAFVLFPLLPGTPRLREDVQHMRTRGRILAALHQDLEPLVEVLGQRPGWRRADEVLTPDQCRNVERRLADLQSVDGEVVRVLGRHVEQLSERLPKATRDFSLTVTHGDLIARNVLFEGADLTGILDLDSTHVDFRAADIACARRSRHDEVVRGYLETTSLSDAERRCLDELWKASVVRYVLELLYRQELVDITSELAWCAKQLEQTRPFDG
jgi:Ser/Thr protein kinase RdoA (MazF antagonist)